MYRHPRVEKHHAPGLLLDLAIAQRALSKVGARDARKILSAVSPRESVALFKLARQCPEGALVLEIGSWYGKSSCYLAAALADRKGRLLCVDTWNNDWIPGGNRDIYADFLRNIGKIPNITPVRKRSEDLSAADFDRPVSLAFIDGDHSYEGAKRDFEGILPFLDPQAKVAFHDSNHFAGVSRVIGEALAGGRWMLGGFARSLCWLVPADFMEDIA